MIAFPEVGKTPRATGAAASDSAQTRATCPCGTLSGRKISAVSSRPNRSEERTATRWLLEVVKIPTSDGTSATLDVGVTPIKTGSSRVRPSPKTSPKAAPSAGSQRPRRPNEELARPSIRASVWASLRAFVRAAMRLHSVARGSNLGVASDRC